MAQASIYTYIQHMESTIIFLWMILRVAKSNESAVSLPSQNNNCDGEGRCVYSMSASAYIHYSPPTPHFLDKHTTFEYFNIRKRVLYLFVTPWMLTLFAAIQQVKDFVIKTMLLTKLHQLQLQQSLRHKVQFLLCVLLLIFNIQPTTIFISSLGTNWQQQKLNVFHYILKGWHVKKPLLNYAHMFCLFLLKLPTPKCFTLPPKKHIRKQTEFTQKWNKRIITYSNNNSSFSFNHSFLSFLNLQVPWYLLKGNWFESIKLDKNPVITLCQSKISRKIEWMICESQYNKYIHGAHNMYACRSRFESVVIKCWKLRTF